MPCFSTMKINSLIFKELLKRGYSLDGKTRIWNIADSKLWYLTPQQAQGFLEMESNSKDYQEGIVQKEIDLINEHIDKIMQKLSGNSVNIIDLGCGDGKKAVLFLKHLKGKVKLRYCPIDISDFMVNKAIEKISQVVPGEVVKFQWNISDFEYLENIASILRIGNYQANLTLLLGNTLGNFEFHDLIYQIQNSMKEGEFLLIGNGLNNQKEEALLRAYKNEEQNKFLVKMITQLGIDENDVVMDVKFRNSRVELFYTLKKDYTIRSQNKKIDFYAGDQILTLVSYKYNKETFEKHLKMYFKDVKLYPSFDNGYALALCMK